MAPIGQPKFGAIHSNTADGHGMVGLLWLACTRVSVSKFADRSPLARFPIAVVMVQVGVQSSSVRSPVGLIVFRRRALWRCPSGEIHLPSLHRSTLVRVIIGAAKGGVL